MQSRDRARGALRHGTEGSSRSRAASELAEMFARADGETEALPDKGPDAAARSALEFLRRLTESLGLVE
ncbi:MAG: hypothetical protein ACLS3M_13360 [Collinsella sp.]